MPRFWFLLATLFVLAPATSLAQGPPPSDSRLQQITAAISPGRIEADIRKLAGFGTRHTLSDTTSTTRGIGAARRWIHQEFKRISEACGDCLEVVDHRTFVEGGSQDRMPHDVWVVNIYAILRGTDYPDHYVMMSGDIDSRVSDPNDFTSDSPGANDNASGMAGAIEAARVLSQHRFPKSIVLAGLSGEEQGLFGGEFLAAKAKAEGWKLEAVLNNDMIGNISGIDGITENRSYRIFSEPFDATLEESTLRRMRYFGGEVDGPSRQLARQVAWISRAFLPEMQPLLIYRLDRFGRGGHHRPFNDEGFPAVRLMETHEHYDRQHQDLRNVDGRHYGDTVEFVDFDFAAKMTAVNAVALAQLAAAPPRPAGVTIEGAVQASATLRWEVSPGAAGYRVHWRRTDEPQWSHHLDIGDRLDHEFTNMVIDNWLFGVSALSEGGHTSTVAFPQPAPRR